MTNIIDAEYIQKHKLSEASERLNESVFAWLIHLSLNKGYSKNTIFSYHFDIKDFLKFKAVYDSTIIDVTHLMEANLQDFRAWVASRKNAGKSPRSLARGVSSLRTFYSYLKKYEDLENDYIYHLQINKLPKSLPRSVDAKQVENVIEQLGVRSKEKWVNFRNQAILVLIYGLGLRISEGLSVKYGDFEGDYLSVLGKGKKERNVPISPIVKEFIEKYVASCPHQDKIKFGEAHLFLTSRGENLSARSFQEIIKEVSMSLNLPTNATPHAYRHSFATHLLEGGLDLREVQELLGHENLSTTQIYTKIDVGRLKEVYKKTHPRNRPKNQ